ncbi:hypothetical protein [Streptomyces sp. NPDC088766]|uniref:hypothetical protein n=1 Tax=Streptomyces sp. NPDC088766 TaxID=3365893 RepID=UPI003802B33B
MRRPRAGPLARASRADGCRRRPPATTPWSPRPAASGARCVALVGHGAAIRTWTAARARNVDVPFAAAHRLANTGVIVLDGTHTAGFEALTWAGATVAPAGGNGPAGEPLGAAG